MYLGPVLLGVLYPEVVLGFLVLGVGVTLVLLGFEGVDLLTLGVVLLVVGAVLAGAFLTPSLLLPLPRLWAWASREVAAKRKMLNAQIESDFFIRCPLVLSVLS